jgi:hypothetical protein
MKYSPDNRYNTIPLIAPIILHYLYKTKQIKIQTLAYNASRNYGHITFRAIQNHSHIQNYNFDLSFVCHISSLTVREEHRLRAFENRVIRKIFATNSYEAPGEWRRLHDEELYGLCYPQNNIHVIKSTRMRWTGYVSHVGDKRMHTGFW